MTDAPFSLAELDEYLDDHATSSGQGGYVCQVGLEKGWIPNPYPKGLKPFERFFSVEDHGDDAEEMATNLGKDGAKLHLQFALYGDSIVNRDAPEWPGGNGNRLFQMQPWELGYTDYLRPSLEEAAKQGFLGGRREWVHVQIVLNEKLKERYPHKNEEWVPVIVEYFPTEEAAREYAENMGVDDAPFEIPPQPEKWEEKFGSWRDQVIKWGKLYQDDPNHKETAFDAAGVTDEVLEEIKKNALEAKDDLPF